MVRHGWDWCMVSKMATTTCFLVASGYKFGLSQTYFSPQDWVCTDWFRQFTASQPFQCVIISIMNGWRRWRLEFTLHNHHHTLLFESQRVKILALGPYVSHQVWACTDWISHFISAQPFQSLIISIMNDCTRLRLVYDHWDSHHKPFSGYEWVQIWLDPYLLFAPRLSVYWLIQTIHSIPTLPIFHH